MTLILLLLTAAWGTSAQYQPADNADHDAMYEHFHKAKEIAGLDLYPHFAHACIVDQHYRWTISRGIQQPGDIRPLQVMDHLYFVGQNQVSAWAIETSEGIILIDAMNNGEEVQKYVLEGFREVGLDPEDIKYVVVTHSHGDHFGGSKYLKDAFGAKIVASKIDWDVMEKMKGDAGRGEAAAALGRPVPERWAKLVPEREVAVEDGETLELGDFTLHFYVTPGHTPGTLALVFKMTDQGEEHVVALYGSLGMPRTVEDKKIVLSSIAKFRAIAEEAGVDTLIANHQTRDLALHKLEILRLRRAGDANPFVVGKEGYLRYLDLQTECVYYAMAREGQLE